MKKIVQNPIFLSLLIISLYTIIAYALLIPSLGFYSDDIFFGYVGHFYKPAGIIESLLIDRPLDGYFLAFYYKLFNDNVIYWHTAILAVRLIGVYFLFFTLKKLWPKDITAITSITLLFAIYPGFLQQPLALGFIIWITALSLIVVSLNFTIYAIKSTKKLLLWVFTFLSIVSQITTFFLLEFFIGVEILRMLLITYSLKKSHQHLKNVLFYWMPYVLTTVLFVLWRILLFKSTRDVTDINWVAQNYYTSVTWWIFKLPLEFLFSFFHTVVLSFFLPSFVNFLRIPLIQSVTSLVVGLSSSVIIIGYFKYMGSFNKNNNRISSKSLSQTGKKFVYIGVFSILAALLPIIISGRIVREYLVYDRYTITSMIGVGFLVVGFLLWKFSTSSRRLILVVVVAASITSHLLNGFYRADNWATQKNIWWQLYWRSPEIESNAFLIFDFPEITKKDIQSKIINRVRWNQIYWVDYQIWTTGNMFFNYSKRPDLHFRGEFLSTPGVIQKILDGTKETLTDRNITYNKNFKQSVIISVPNDTSCMWVYDKNRLEVSQSTDETVKSLISYSDPDVLVAASTPSSYPPTIFGKEPEKSWCYYYQKASLARQLKDWKQLDFLTKTVTSNNNNLRDVNEWLPFIEGMIILKKFPEANTLIQNILSDNDTPTDIFVTNICNMTKRLKVKDIKINCKPKD